MIRATTHILAFTGHCRDCGTDLLGTLVSSHGQIRPGALIGKLVSTHGGTRCYPIGEHDSNPRCSGVAKTERQEAHAL